MKRIIINTILFFFAANSFCQTASLDQLIANYYKLRIELERMNPAETPDLCLEKAMQFLELYKDINRIDSTKIQPHVVFMPYSIIAYYHYERKNYKDAIPYLEDANNIAKNHSSKLLKMGFTNDALLGVSTSLRDAYTETGEYDKALAISHIIISTYEHVNPKHCAFQQMAESQIYKLKDDALKVIESDLKALDLFAKHGNDVQGFYAESLVNEILEGFMYVKDYDRALEFIDGNRDRLNNMFEGKDNLEFEKLNQTNKYLYRIYMYKGLYLRAVNAAYLVSNFTKMADGENSPVYASWISNAACSFLDLYSSEDNPDYLNKADSLFNVAGDIWVSISDRNDIIDYATYLGNVGNCHSAKKEYDKAEIKLLESLSLYEKQGCSDDYILPAKMRIAKLYGDKGNVKQSISLHKELLEQYEHRCDTIQIARICNLLSQLYWMEHEDNEMSEFYANKAYEILHQANIKNELAANVTENLARIYSRLGLNERALHYSMESLKIKNDIGIGISPYEQLNVFEFYVDQFSDVLYYNPEGQDHIMTDVETICNDFLSSNKGDSYVEKCLRWKAKKVLGKTYMFFRRFDKAEEQFQKLLEIEEDLWGKNSNNYIVTLNNLAYCFGLKGDYEKCRNYSLASIEYDPTHKNYENVLASSIALGDSAMVEKYLPLTFKNSLDYLKTQFLFFGAEQREEIIEQGGVVGFSNLSLPACVYPNNSICAEYAYNSAIVSKGLLLSMQNDIESSISQSNDDKLKSEYNGLKQMQKQLQQTSDSVNVMALKRNIELKEKEILTSVRGFEDFMKNLNLTWKDVQKELDNNDVAIEFVELHKSILSRQDTTAYYGALLLKKEWSAPKFILLAEMSETDAIIKDLLSEFNEANGYSETEWDNINRQIYENIWEPLSTYLTPGCQVFFSPIGLLALAPMEILRNKEGRNLNEQYELYRISSTKNLCLSKPILQKQEAVLYGGLIYDDKSATYNVSTKREGWQYLSSTAIEVESIGNLLRQNNISTQVFDKLNGTEESFKSLSGKAISILHLATHGFYFDENESNTYDFFKDMNVNVKRGAGISTLLRSGLMLSGGQGVWLHGKKDFPKDKEDGILLSSEISLLDLHKVDLVTLSACQTGLGDISDDGVMGLQRGFKRAGVNSILMSLWPVDDEPTKILMEQFYENLILGQSKRQSLQSAQKYIREIDGGKYNEPKYWAAFIILDAID